MFALIVVIAIKAFFSWKRPKKEKKMSRKDKRELKRLLYAAQLQSSRERSAQQLKYDTFKDSLQKFIAASKNQNYSLVRFTKGVLDQIEDEMIAYEGACTKSHYIGQYMPNYYAVIMMHGMQAVIEYSGRKGLQAIGMDLMQFVEHHFRIKNLNGVLYRHRQHLHYADRCECMAVAILEFFGRPISQSVIMSCAVPFDMCKEDEDLTTWDNVRHEFFERGIDQYFAGAVKHVERENYATQARLDNQEHQKNRRQRSARIKKQNRKARKMNYA
ncbi:hypothetical protein [Ralstonia phage RSL2]|uniref:Uncharacterized protein n=1 Tax=Ralstonia phage RSL2 TaxID=1585840 RepID=A0A0A8J903_9CAUD|nr:hypothetical protein [Ralstonia phage RSL2]